MDSDEFWVEKKIEKPLLTFPGETWYLRQIIKLFLRLIFPKGFLFADSLFLSHVLLTFFSAALVTLDLLLYL